MMGVGGSLEVFSGTKKSAPSFRNLNIEWVYRLLIDWKRIGRIKVFLNLCLKFGNCRIRRKIKRMRLKPMNRLGLYLFTLQQTVFHQVVV